MKNISKFKTFILSSFAFLALSACSPKEDGVDIKALIPQEVDIAFYAKANQEMIKELKAIPEYKELLVELKKYNKDLNESYLEIISKAEIPQELRTLAEAIIAPSDIVGSLESLFADNQISIAGYSKDTMLSSMKGEPNAIIAIKIANEKLAKDALNLLSFAAKEEKTQLDGYPLFVSKDKQNYGNLHILSVKDTFLFSMSKSALENALSEIKKPTKSILDSVDFKNTITKPDCDMWFYASEKLASLVSALTKTPAIVKSVGIQVEAESLQEATLRLEINLNENDYYKAICEGYSEFKNKNAVKNIYDDTVYFISINLPNSDKGYDILAKINPAISVLTNGLKQIKCVELALSEADIKKLPKADAPNMLANLYVKSSNELLSLVGKSNKSINEVEIFETPKANVAKISDTQIMLSNKKDEFESLVDIAKSAKNNDKISKALAKISLENCIAEAYVDIKAMQEASGKAGVEALPEILKEIQAKASAMTKKSDIAAKISLDKDGLKLVAKSDSQYDYKAAKDFILYLIEKREDLAKEILDLSLGQ